MIHDGITYVTELSKYQQVLNRGSKQVLGYMEPFKSTLDENRTLYRKRSLNEREKKLITLQRMHITIERLKST